LAVEVGGSGGVAGAAADDEVASWVSAFGDFADVVGGEVGGLVGGLASPAGAPVADDGAMVGYHPGAAASFGVVVVEVRTLGALRHVLDPLAVDTPRLAPYWS